MAKLSIVSGVALILIGSAVSVSEPAIASTRTITSNAVDKCQAFTPGVTNTIRNRVRGAENIGSATIPVVCSFETNQLSGVVGVEIQFVNIAFENGGTSPVSVVCNLLPGSVDQFGDQRLISVQLPAGAQKSIQFEDAIGTFAAIGVNCNIPSKVTITKTVLEYVDAD